MQQIEGENIVTCSRNCSVVIGLMKAFEQPKNSNLSYCKNSSTICIKKIVARF